jgi:catalase
MAKAEFDHTTAIAKEALQALDDLNGPQPGFRPAHAKGILLAGLFTPSASAKSVTRAPHLQRSSTAVTVRFSNSTGIPNIPDNDPNAGPRGIAIRFHLAEHVHTDIIAHSADGFPVHTIKEFVELLRAVHASGPDAAKPTPIEKFLGSHPAALEFVQLPKPMPTSFARLSYYAPSAYRFTNDEGISQYGRYRIRPEADDEYLDPTVGAIAPPNFLFDEIEGMLKSGSVKMRVTVQLAETGDVTNDATVHWPKDRREVDFGIVELRNVVPNNHEEQRHIIFDPIPRVDGIEPSEDPLLEARATLYLMSGRRRRSQTIQAKV